MAVYAKDIVIDYIYSRVTQNQRTLNAYGLTCHLTNPQRQAGTRIFEPTKSNQQMSYSLSTAPSFIPAAGEKKKALFYGALIFVRLYAGADGV